MKRDAQIEKRGKLAFKVNKEVVSHLSRGLYRNFARAIKELLSNAYDAGATEVKIKLDLSNAEIIVRDNGRGMDIKEIKEKFLTIGYITPLSDSVDELGRRRIGTFGIGCVAVFPYCETLQVITKKRNSNKIIEFTINTEHFFSGIPAEIGKEKVPYTIHKSDLPRDKGETIIFLKGIKPHLIKELRQKRSLGRASIDKFSGFQKFRWTLSQYAPLQFSPEMKELSEFFNEPKNVPIRVWLDGEQLFRNIPEDAKILEKDERKFGNVSLKYVIMTSMKPIEPGEARGLQVRLRNVAIGLPRDFEVTKLTGKVPGKLNYLSGEIHIISGLDNALMIDRDSLSYTQEVADMQEFFRKKLISWNGTLEKWAREDKEVYESLSEIKEGESVIKELTEAGIIRFSKGRLRLPKLPLVKRGKKEIIHVSKKIRKALSKRKEYEIVSKKGKVPGGKLPIEISTKKKAVIVYEDHPSFVETIKIEKKEFKVTYDSWDPEKTPYSICKFSDGQDKVIFNSSHPIFKSSISDEIIKRLSLGILIILKDRKDKEELLCRLNRLLKNVFQR